MSRKEARSEVVSTTPKQINRKRQPRFGRQWIGRYRHLRLAAHAHGQLVGERSDFASIPQEPSEGCEDSGNGAAARQSSNDERAAAPRGQANARVMAIVNGQEIKRDALGTACVERFGKDVLEGLVNKRLIMHHCRNRNIEVTDQEVDAEIERMAKRFKIGREQWLQMLERERGINAEQYKRDILWPTLALRKCAADQLVINDAQLNEAYEPNTVRP